MKNGTVKNAEKPAKNSISKIQYNSLKELNTTHICGMIQREYYVVLRGIEIVQKKIAFADPDHYLYFVAVCNADPCRTGRPAGD
ncbi:MAG: hypothetical protein IJS27_01425 [Ruminococcus sp.]|nr:hypothetical protein [Ruminococcus sp.]